MIRLLQLMPALVLAAGPALAQGLVLPGTQDPPSAPGPAATPGDACVGATAGAARSYGCINDQQRALVAQHQATIGRTTLDQNAAPQKLGLFNQAAEREHLGNNFGRSNVPQAVPPPNYPTPLIPPR